MSNNQDHLSNEISVAAKIEETGVSASVKSRTISAVDRLIGGLFDVPAAYLDGKAARVRAKNESAIALIREQGKAQIADLYADSTFGERVAERFAQDEARKQLNREAVATNAIEYLREGSDVSGVSGDERIDDDWMNLFEEGAEKASSEHLRQLWGRVLAGEIRKPGSFSRSTVRFLCELDRKTANAFERYSSVRFPSGEILRPDRLENEILSDILFFESTGLIIGMDAGILKIIKSKDDGSIFIPFDNLLLWMRMAQPNTDYRITVIHMTRIGVELLTILPKPDFRVTMRAIVAHLKDAVKEADIRLLTPSGPDTYNQTVIEKIR